MDRGDIRIPINGAILGGRSNKEIETAWTKRIIICLKCGWQGAETPNCPRCGIPLRNYSLTIIPV